MKTFVLALLCVHIATSCMVFADSGKDADPSDPRCNSSITSILPRLKELASTIFDKKESTIDALHELQHIFQNVISACPVDKHNQTGIALTEDCKTDLKSVLGMVKELVFSLHSTPKFLLKAGAIAKAIPHVIHSCKHSSSEL